jgi:7,8-dihydroneopterin aldolase/epimerase/oxygenase
LDIIFISDFRLEILVGVYEWERRVPQTVQLDLEIGLPPREKRSDRIGETIDYAKVVARIEASLAENRFLLVEALAEHVAQLVMTEFGAPWIRASAGERLRGNPVGFPPRPPFLRLTRARFAASVC